MYNLQNICEIYRCNWPTIQDIAKNVPLRNSYYFLNFFGKRFPEAITLEIFNAEPQNLESSAPDLK